LGIRRGPNFVGGQCAAGLQVAAERGDGSSRRPSRGPGVRTSWSRRLSRGRAILGLGGSECRASRRPMQSCDAACGCGRGAGRSRLRSAGALRSRCWQSALGRRRPGTPGRCRRAHAGLAALRSRPSGEQITFASVGPGRASHPASISRPRRCHPRSPPSECRTRRGCPIVRQRLFPGPERPC